MTDLKILLLFWKSIQLPLQMLWRLLNEVHDKKKKKNLWISSGNTLSQTENKILYWLKTHKAFTPEVSYDFLVNEP